MTDIKMLSNFVLWFHKVDNDKWDLSSYTKIMTLSNYEDLKYCLTVIKDITSGMYFLMKEGINPIWEDKNNKNGGFWTFKVSKSDSYNLWTELLLYICINGITKNNESIINGISLSPKINNCIFKIWNNNSKFKDLKILKNDLKYLDINEGLYRKHEK